LIFNGFSKISCFKSCRKVKVLESFIGSIEKLIKRKIKDKRTSFNNIYKVNLPEGAEIQPNEIQSRGESTFTQDDDESTLTQSPPAQSTLPLLDVPDEEKFIFENNLIKVKTQEEIIKTLKSKPFSLKDDIIQQIIKTTSPRMANSFNFQQIQNIKTIPQTPQGQA